MPIFLKGESNNLSQLLEALRLGVDYGYVLDYVLDFTYYDPIEGAYMHKVCSYDMEKGFREHSRIVVVNVTHCSLTVNQRIVAEAIVSVMDYTGIIKTSDAIDRVLKECVTLLLLGGMLVDRENYGTV
jgi:hypothetical protein